MKKQKWLSVAVATVLVVTFCGCGKELGMLAQHKQTEEGFKEPEVSGEEIAPEHSQGDDAGEKPETTVPTHVPSTQISSEQQQVIDRFAYQVPREENWYIVEVPGGMEVTYDLNGDGVDETLYYATMQDESGERLVSSLLVNQKEYRDELGMAGAREQIFSVVDLLEEDDFYELAFYAKPQDGEERTYFFRYDGDKLYHIGTVSGYVDTAAIDSGEAHLDGNGNIYSMFELQLLADYEAPGVWQVSDAGKIQKVSEELYCPLALNNRKVVVKEEVKLYMERNVASEYMTILPSDKTVSLQATDDKEWLLISVDNKATGWLNKQSMQSLGVATDR